jgi:hypothetical protein
MVQDRSGGDVAGKMTSTLSSSRIVPAAPAIAPRIIPSAGNIPPGKKLTGGRRSSQRKNRNLWV